MLTVERLKELIYYNPEAGVFTWRVSRPGVRAGAEAGTTCLTGYREIMVDGCRYLSHRLAWFYVTSAWPRDQIDHKNGRTDDNRWENLREATHTTNAQNQRAPRKNNVSGFLGVSPSGSKWLAQIRTNGKVEYLGTFATPEEAHASYLSAKRELHEGCMI